MEFLLLSRFLWLLIAAPAAIVALSPSAPPGLAPLTGHSPSFSQTRRSTARRESSVFFPRGDASNVFAFLSPASHAALSPSLPTPIPAARGSFLAPDAHFEAEPSPSPQSRSPSRASSHGSLTSRPHSRQESSATSSAAWGRRSFSAAHHPLQSSLSPAAAFSSACHASPSDSASASPSPSSPLCSPSSPPSSPSSRHTSAPASSSRCPLSSEYSVRLAKASSLLRQLALTPFPPTSSLLSLIPSALSSPSSLHRRFRSLPPGSAASPQEVFSVAGRVQSIRNGGMFIDLWNPADEAKLQLFVSLNSPSSASPQNRPSAGSPRGEVPSVDLLPFLDLGDFLLARGTLRRTSKGELTLHVERCGGLHLVAKRLLPLDLSLSLSSTLPAASSASSPTAAAQHAAPQRPRNPKRRGDQSSSTVSAPAVLEALRGARASPPSSAGPSRRPAGLARASEGTPGAASLSPWTVAHPASAVCGAFSSLPSPQRDAQLLHTSRLRETLRLRSLIVHTVRQKLIAEDFLEVDTAVLQPAAAASSPREKSHTGLRGAGAREPPRTEETPNDAADFADAAEVRGEGRPESGAESDAHRGSEGSPTGEKAAPTARLFDSYLHALDMPVQLRVAPELALKRLVVSGISDKIFEIGRCFRNEGISWRHQPEFLSMEAYATFWTYEDMIALTEEVVRLCAAQVVSLKASSPYRDAEPPAPSAARQNSLLSSLLSFVPWSRRKPQRCASRVTGRDTRGTSNASAAGEWDSPSPGVRISWQGQEIDLSAPWRRLTMVEALREYAGIDFERLSHAEAVREVEWRLERKQKDGEMNGRSSSPSFASLASDGSQERGDFSEASDSKNSGPKTLRPECYASVEELMDFAFKEWVEKRLVQPTHILHTPLALSPLAAEKRTDPEARARPKIPVAERFEAYIGGMEIADGYSELTDPLEQLQRFSVQAQTLRNRGEGKAQRHLEAPEENESEKANRLIPNQEFIAALMLGLPPTAGLGIGLDRLVMLLTDSPLIRDVVHMPLRKSVF
ncbi:tRNA ligases class II (D, K and N) domain-containing protein [Besnoitia besnoiti]|uniref:tRNA ligases class II (D, K and N) domain-containing protein n=1 Tax=Besnoitia besnoiti TaxID=94643 RepID=A0A2A9MM32_BESBE|nr:tRNA ligases class II (D, K and N) domain-containing protein [Besnoitia besnoiti]PFH36580.1 tRNA ligases class II (D, K and N) domain-containing protein [Besnoitia besnoiti]